MLASDFRRRAIMLAHQQNRTKRRSTLAFLQTLELQQSSSGGGACSSSNPPSPRRKLLLRRGECDSDSTEGHGFTRPVGPRPASPKDAPDEDDDSTHATTSCSLSECHESCATGSSSTDEDGRGHGPTGDQDCESYRARTTGTGDDDTFVTATSRSPPTASGGLDLESSAPFVIGVVTPPRRTWTARRKAGLASSTRRAAAREGEEEDDGVTRQIETWAREAEEAHRSRRKRVCRDAICGADGRPEEVKREQVIPAVAQGCRLEAEGCDDSSQMYVAESCTRLSLALSLCLLLYYC